MKPIAAESRLLRHEVERSCSDSYDEIDATHRRFLRRCRRLVGLRSAQRWDRRAAGHARSGTAAIPKKLLQAGVRDVLRISDARMSARATARASCTWRRIVRGGPLALLKEGDVRQLDVEARRIDMLVATTSSRAGKRVLRTRRLPARYGRSFSSTSSGHEGCDFDFLEGGHPYPNRRSTDDVPPARSHSQHFRQDLLAERSS